MLKKWMLLATLCCLLAGGVFAQGLSTNASKDDWEEINFEFNSAVLSDGYPSLLRLADLLHAHAGYHVKIEGNTDNIGSAQYNEKLGLARANTVKDFLVKYGASAGQLDVTTRGKSDPKYPGYKNTYTKTDVSRWMNRRVVLTVTDETGKTVSAGGPGEAIRAIGEGELTKKCCDDILKRLDKLDDIAKMLQQLMDQNNNMRKELDALKNQQAALQGQQGALQNQLNTGPKPLTEQQTGEIVEKKLAAAKEPRFALLGANVGSDDRGNVTFSGKGRYFAPFAEHFAFQAQAEYLYFRTQREGQLDFGLVDRIGNFQGGLFTSFKHVNLRDAANGGTLGQGALTLDYIFKMGRIGLFGTKGFMNNAVLDRRNATFATGQLDASGSPIFAIAPNLFLERYLSIVDQAGASTTLGLWGNNYVEANIGYLRSAGHADRPGGTVRFVFPIKNRFAFTAEGGVNETLLGANNTGRAVFGFEWGNFMRPKEFLEVKHPVPVDIPRVRYEILTRRIKVGASPPIADAGPDQIGVPAGTITLNGSNSRDPNGEALTFQWVQEAGPPVNLSAQTQAITTFQAAAGQEYVFRLTVRNTDGLSASARTRVSTRVEPRVQILFFIADPSTIQGGQVSVLNWRILNADSASITASAGVSPGPVNASSGPLNVNPAVTTVYTLTAKNATSSDLATVQVTVQNPTPRFLVCTAIPMNISAGESARIFFQTVNADKVSIEPGFPSLPPNGDVVVTPTVDTNYRLTASNSSGSVTDSCSVGIKVTPGTAPRIVRFTGAPLVIPSGGVSTLLWQVENATKVTITPDVGDVTLVGTKDVTLTQDTTYTLTASNNFGTVSQQVTIRVIQPPPPPLDPIITSFTANPPTSPKPGTPVVLTCLAQNAATVLIDGFGPVDKNGMLTVTPFVTTTYICAAINIVGKVVTKSLTVPVLNPGGGTMGPTIVVNSLAANCTSSITAGGVIVCETVVRLIDLDFSGSSSPQGNTPLSFFTTSRQISSVVLGPNNPKISVQLSETFGDYFFDVTVTDSQGNVSVATIDVRYVRTNRN